MANTLLKPSVFSPHALVRNNEAPRNTVIEDRPQVSVRRAPPTKMQPRRDVLSPMSDDFPTPRANVPSLPRLTARDLSDATSSDTESESSSTWSKRSSSSEFDEMYDMSGSDSEEVPIKLSSSVKKRMGKKEVKTRFPSLVIPSPSQWPTIDKYKSSTPLSPPIQMVVSPVVLARLRDQASRVPSTSSTPSLDGSLTSEELAASSCPSTPDLRSNDDDSSWDPPVQLDASSFNLLQHINADEPQEQNDIVIEIPMEAVEEMREIVESPPVTGRFKLDTQNLAPPSLQDADDELSALSVPSPGGFFASLDSSIARSNWSSTTPALATSTATEFYGVPFRSPTTSTLPTSTATSFYGVPWTSRPENPVEHFVALGSPTNTQDPPTARKIVFSPTEVITEVAELDETYSDALKENATANIDRTQMWLCAQNDYMQSICSENEEEAVVDADLESLAGTTCAEPGQAGADVDEPQSASTTASKKAVHFAVEPKSATSSLTASEQKRISPIHDGTFWQGWRHAKRSQRARDVFQHRQARAEAEQVNRISLQKQHAAQLAGKFEITQAERPSPQRPISSFLPAAPEDEKAALIARASCERQALEQLQSSAWHLAAQKEVNGGKLLTSPVVQSFKGRMDVRVLDLAGHAQCSWAWSVAMEHPDASIFTTVSSDAEAHVAQSSHEGPMNHHVVASPSLWELPFEDNFFDVVSARTVHMQLRTIWPKGKAADEWDLTLRECLRVLKPGGYLEFDLLDAELVHPDAVAQALGVEFAFNLKTRGYDPTAGKSFLPRLKRAGFSDIKRAWIVLPVAQVAPRWTDAGKTPGSDGSTCTLTPGSAADSYFGADAGERSIASDGTVSELKAPLTGSTKDVRAMTGLVGARMWEQWMLKLNGEMGRSEKRCLDDVAKALEECGDGNAGWRCLVGWARKSA